MRQKCKCDKKRDLGYTIPDLAIDITEAVTTGVIKQTQVGVESYNMMQDTDEIGLAVRDNFTAMDAQRGFDAQVNQMSTQTE